MVVAEDLREVRGRVMGTEVHLLALDADAAALADALKALEALERRWSRFLPDSEISLLNAADGAPIEVGRETVALLETMRAAWVRTCGRYDPTVLPALEQAGYDRSFDRIASPHGERLPAAPAPGLAGLEIVETSVRLPTGVRIDPGGIGKGLAADLVATELVASGRARAAIVNLGGDLRIAGEGLPWGIALDERPDLQIGLVAGAVATSTTTRRWWLGPDRRPRHHVIDPATGAPAVTAHRCATVVAGTAADAEALATLVLLDGAGAADIVAAAGATALAVDHEGELHLFEGMAEYLWSAGVESPAETVREVR